jgi:hypothetical protein
MDSCIKDGESTVREHNFLDPPFISQLALDKI